MTHRYPKLKRGPDGKYVCRGCGAPIPKGRQTWCSRECYQLNCPQAVIMIVRNRDNDICQLCGYDYRAAKREWHKLEPDYSSRKPGDISWVEWKKLRPRKIECHHKRPFSEGGTHAPENMMTLCHDCHSKVTAEWRKAKRNQ